MRYMIDTNICIHMMQHNPNVLSAFSKKKEYGIGISAITFAELEYGVRNSSSNKAYEQNRDKLILFLPLVKIIPFDASASVEYGKVRASLRRKGNLIGLMDMLIAAHVLSCNMTLVSNNTYEFARIEGLRLEDWC